MIELQKSYDEGGNSDLSILPCHLLAHIGTFTLIDVTIRKGYDSCL